MNNKLSSYSVEFLQDSLSLDASQTELLNLLEKVTTIINSHAHLSPEDLVTAVKAVYPHNVNNLRDFISLVMEHSIATGDMQLLMAVIAFLYGKNHYHNFVIIAPNSTCATHIFHSLEQYQTSSPFAWFNKAHIYNELSDMPTTTTGILSFKPLPEASIYICSISQLNRAGSKLKQVNEIMGCSVYNYLASLNNLVVIMDQAQDYCSPASVVAINGLKPVLGIELTNSVASDTNGGANE